MNPELFPALSNPPVLMTLVTGLMLAFALQLLLTSFGVAAGITALGFLPDRADPTSPTQSAKSGGLGTAIGLGTLLSVNSVLFIACFLAIKLSWVHSVETGAILGVVIWSGYFLLLAWLGSSTVGSLSRSLLGGVMAGMQGLVAAVRTVLHRPPAEPALPDPVQTQLATTQATLGEIQRSLEAIQRDRPLQETLQETLQKTLQDYLPTLQAPQPNLPPLQSEFPQIKDYLLQADPWQLTGKLMPGEFQTLLRDPEADSKAVQQQLERLNRDDFVALLQQRQDLSAANIDKIADRLDAVRQEVLQTLQAEAKREWTPEFLDPIAHYLRTAKKADLKPNRLKQQITTLVHAIQADARGLQPPLPSSLPPLDKATVAQWLADRTDLSKKRRQKIIDQVEPLWRSLTAPFQAEPPRLAPPQRLALHTPAKVLDLGQQFVEYLQFAEPEAFSLESHSLPLLQKPAQAALTAVLSQVQHALTQTELPELDYDRIKQDLQTLFAPPTNTDDADTAWLETWSNRLRDFNRDTLAALLQAREELSESVVSQLVDRIDSVRLGCLQQIEQLQQQAQHQVKTVQRQVQQQVEQQAEAARRKLAIAAWWLFGIAFTSLFTSALAGAMAVQGWQELWALMPHFP